MNTLRSSSVRRALATPTLLIASALASSAGGPLAICDSGHPFLWPNGGLNIPFNPDQGDLGPLAHADAVAFVQSAFDVWENVPTSTVTYFHAGELPVDVDITNFASFLAPTAPDGFSAVVFDDTGEIFDLVFGPDSGILGFAGPEWVNSLDCTILEGVSFLNGPAFADPTAAADIMVHEFGHFSGLGHTVVNGQIFIGDTTGPTPTDHFGSPPDPLNEDIVETMYPFYLGAGVGSSTLEKDDISTISALYPEPGHAVSSGTIQGTIYASNNTLPLSGINIIARNITDPFHDAVSAISGDFAVPSVPSDPMNGDYSLTGLTPGADYAVYIDQILAGGFSTPPRLLPGPEEFYNGLDESNNLTTPDDPSLFTAIPSVAGRVSTGIDIFLNALRPGEPLPVGDDESVELSLPFPFRICGQTFNTVSVNANGNLTFGYPEPSPFPNTAAFLLGPPRIAGLWTDLDPTAGGTVTFHQTGNAFSVIWKDVPEFTTGGANSFTITLHKTGNVVTVAYAQVSSVDAIAGISGGSAITTGLETPTDLRSSPRKTINLSLSSQPAAFEEFSGSFDLVGSTVRYQHDVDYNDRWAKKNDTLRNATKVVPPFTSAPMPYFTEIEPVGGDIDFFQIHVSAGTRIEASITRGSFDSYLGLFSQDGQLVAFDDDGGEGLLSSLIFIAPVSGNYTIAATAYGDSEFTGAGSAGGRYVLEIFTQRCGMVEAPNPGNWLFNGSFETANLAGWTSLETGISLTPWTVSDDSLMGFFRPVQPQDGCFLAWNAFDGAGPMQSSLHQDVTTPVGLPFLTLEWKDRLQWELIGFGSTLDRHYRVEIVDPLSDAVLETIYSLTATSGTAVDTTWTTHSADLTAYIGQTIRLRFLQDIPEDFVGPGQFELDDVRLRSR